MKKVGDGDLNAGRHLSILLRDTTRLILRRIQAIAQAHDLSLNQYFVLRELWDDPGLSQKALSVRINLLEPAVVNTLHSMVERDLVVRKKSVIDRRASELFLTRAGTSVTRKIFLEVAAMNVAATSGLREAQVEALEATLVRVRDNLQEAPGTARRTFRPRYLRAQLGSDLSLESTARQKAGRAQRCAPASSS